MEYSFNQLMGNLFKLFDQEPAIPVGMLIFFAVWGIWKRLGRSGRRAMDKGIVGAGLLSQVLFSWSAPDPFIVRDLLRSVVIFGASGSGKSSGSGYLIAKSLARNRKIGGLILASKPEDKQAWVEIMTKAGRLNDLLIFSPASSLRFNFLDEVQRTGDTREITKAIMVIGETLEQGDNGREAEPFWRQQYERMIYNAVEMVRLAYGRVTAPLLQQFINGAANKSEQTKDKDWVEGFHNQTLKKAADNARNPIERHDYQLALEYWLSEYPNMGDKMRSSILAGVLGIAHVFNTGIVRELVSSDTNISPAVFDEGKWVLVDMPISNWGPAGAFVLGGWKYLTQRHILRRKASENTPVCVIFADEAQNVVNSFDHPYLAMCRSHRGCMVYLTQSIHSFYSRIQGKTGEHETDALLTNFYTKIFHQVGDDKTAAYASSLVGKMLTRHTGGSMPPADNPYDELFGQSRFSGSFSEHIENVLEHREFLQGMRTGGEECGFIVDAIVIRGEPFSTGNNYLRVSFDQRG